MPTAEMNRELRTTLALAVALALVAMLVGCGRCHTQHTVVSYHAAYTSTDSHCSMRDDRGNCTFTYYTTSYHPARCSVSTYCDLRCKAMDKGRSEAHPEHPTLRLFPDEVDPRCTLNGAVR